MTAILKISSDKYLELFYDLGCEFAEKKIKDIRDIHKSEFYWSWWTYMWIEHCEAFIEWRNHTKKIADLRHMVFQTRQPDKKVRAKIINHLQHERERNQTT